MRRHIFDDTRGRRNGFMEEYRYKVCSTDFRVNEILNVILDGGDYHYYLLYKRGIRTVDALDDIAREQEISIADITYAGLKDEDAVTIQYISIKDRIIENCSRDIDGGYYRLTYIGDSNNPIIIGRLQGNSFRIRIRKLNHSMAVKIYMGEKHTWSIINYFDVQRFGMPNKPKVTHLIGEYLINQRYEEAFVFMRKSGNIDEDTYFEWRDKEKTYFDRLEIRRKSFFLSAKDSFDWNQCVQNIVSTEKHFLENNKQGIPFIYADLSFPMKKKLLSIPICWHRYDDDGNIYEKLSRRQPYIDVIYRASEVMSDDIFDGTYMIGIDFVLPAGAYATNVIDQLVYQVGVKEITPQ